MSAGESIHAAGGWARVAGVCGIASLGLLMGACSQLGSSKAIIEAFQAPNFVEAANPAPPDGRTELQKATEYWGKEYGKDPRNAKNALNFARNLKALGEKRQALAVLQQVSVFHGNNRELNAEYGRLALEFDQVSLASKLLEQADDPAKPDWKVVSARGTVLAKQGLYREAIPLYERARALAPEEPSILNNLAMAYAMDGKPDAAEPLLRRAAAAGSNNERVRQNLALVLGLQGKHDEAKVAAQDLPAEKGSANVEYVRNLVNSQPKALATASVAKPEGKMASAGERRQAQSQHNLQARAKPEWSTQLAATHDVGEADTSGWSTQVAFGNARR
jgi:Flp pilus assembly protein TadD